jgi:serine/threonine-protein kinase HipA
MRKAQIFQNRLLAGVLEELGAGRYRFTYEQNYAGDPVSLAMPTTQRVYDFDFFPPVFEGLLPEGYQLEALLRRNKIDRTDLFEQLLAVGQDVVGSLIITEVK